MNKSVLSMIAVALPLFPVSLSAHFQTAYTEESALSTEDSQVTIEFVFTHPFEGGPVMEIGKDEQGNVSHFKDIYVINKGNKKTVTESLVEKSYEGPGEGAESASGFVLDYTLRGLGDFVFAAEPEPYWEEEEGLYIQQYTKLILNRGGVPTDWDQPAGMPVEIMPLNQPYAVWTGNVFRGVVKMKQGEEYVPVPNAEVEVEYLNWDLEGGKFANGPKVNHPQESFITQTIYTNQSGEFSYGIPRSGWWGFAAINLIDGVTHKERPVEVGAVLWVEAKDMN